MVHGIHSDECNRVTQSLLYQADKEVELWHCMSKVGSRRVPHLFLVCNVARKFKLDYDTTLTMPLVLQAIQLEELTPPYISGGRSCWFMTTTFEVFNSILKGARDMPFKGYVQIIFCHVYYYFSLGEEPHNALSRMRCSGLPKIDQRVYVYG